MQSRSEAHAHADANADTGSDGQSQGHYISLVVQLVISGIIMFLVMYLMIASLAHFQLNLNNLYMTLAMLAPMGVVMMLAMPSMFQDRRLNIVLYAGLGIVFLVGVWFTRAQTFIGDEQFLRSMIPHHSGAILMCNEADIADPEIVALCGRIIQSQSQEIAQMEAILNRL
jgi:hypothetical protein